MGVGFSEGHYIYRDTRRHTVTHIEIEIEISHNPAPKPNVVTNTCIGALSSKVSQYFMKCLSKYSYHVLMIMFISPIMVVQKIKEIK